MTRKEYNELMKSSFLFASNTITTSVKGISEEDLYKNLEKAGQSEPQEPEVMLATSLSVQTTLIAYMATHYFLRGAGIISITDEQVLPKGGASCMTREEYDDLVAKHLSLASEAIADNVKNVIENTVNESRDEIDGYLPPGIGTTIYASGSARIALIAFDAMLNFLQDTGIIVITD